MVAVVQFWILISFIVDISTILIWSLDFDFFLLVAVVQSNCYGEGHKKILELSNVYFCHFPPQIQIVWKMKRKKTQCFFALFIFVIFRPVIEKQIVFESHDGVSLFLSALGLVHLSHAVKIGPFPIYQWSVPNQCWLLSMRKKKIHSLSPPQRVCCVCVWINSLFV